jgi:peptidoglycan/LPS O-acetylase OafA/YrhL
VARQSLLSGVMSETRVFGLDFLRALAIMLVLFAHASFMFLPLTHRLEAVWMLGQLGVELFFVLSGFLIGAILVKQAEAARFGIGRFWLRRWLRTLPNYYLFLAINIGLARWIDGAWPHAAGYAVFMQNFAWPQPIFFIESWSLAVEEIFYLIAPLLVLACSGRVMRRVPAALLVSIAIALATLVRIVYVVTQQPVWDQAVRMVTVVRLDAIAYGALALLLYRHRDGVARRHANVIAGAGCAGTAIAIALYLVLPKDTDLFARAGLFSLFSASFAAFLPAAANWHRSGVPAPIENGIRAIARWSYALYLCQLAVMRVMNATFAGNAQSFAGCLLQAIIFVVLSIASAALVYRFYEAPILRLRDRWTRESKSRAPADAAPEPLSDLT